MESADEKPLCDWPMDAQGFVNLRDMPTDVVPCRIPPGFRGWVSQVALQHADGSPADSDYLAEAEAPRKVRKKMDPKTAPHEEAHAPAALELPNSVASVAVPEGLPDLKAIIPADGKVTGSSVAMALIAVAGSGAVIKMVKGWLDKRAELQEKELELRAEQQRAEQEQKRDDHGKCEAAREALAAEMRSSAAELRAAAESAKAANSQITDAVTQLSERVSTLERTALAKAKPQQKSRAKRKA
jgi:hypothetical protein